MGVVEPAVWEELRPPLAVEQGERLLVGEGRGRTAAATGAAVVAA